MKGSDPITNKEHQSNTVKDDSLLDDSITRTLVTRLETTEREITGKYRIKAVIAVKDSGLPLFHLNLERQDIDIEKTNLISGLMSALWMYASQVVQQEIKEIFLEDDKVVFRTESNGKAILAVIAEKAVPSSILTVIANDVCNLLFNEYSQAIKFTYTETLQDEELSRKIREIVQKHTAKKPKELRKLLFKLVLMGDGAVGKTSLFNRFMGKGFRENYLLTVGADFGVKNITLGDQEEIKFLVTDVAGQPHFREVRKAYYKGTFGGMIVIDITRPETFKNSAHWLNEAWKHGAGPFPIIFLGNKEDLRTKGTDCVGHERIRKLTDLLSREAERTKGFKIHYIPTSAKTGLNVDLAFETLGIEILNWLKQGRLVK